MELRVTVDPDLPKVLTEPAVGFGPFESTRAGVVVYGPAPGATALSRLYVDLICGRPLPLTFVTRSVGTLETVVAAALFLDRELCLHPGTAGLVAAVELASQLQEGGLAHVGRDLARLFLLIDGYLCSRQADKAEQGRRLEQAVGWLRGYVLEGSLPSLPRAPEPPSILDRGTNGFVLATTGASLVDAVVELYRLGHLRGVVFRPTAGGDRVLAFRKSPHVRFDLQGAEAHLNAAEARMGALRRWKLERFLLAGPPQGTLIRRQDLIDTFLRV